MEQTPTFAESPNDALSMALQNVLLKQVLDAAVGSAARDPLGSSTVPTTGDHHSQNSSGLMSQMTNPVINFPVFDSSSMFGSAANSTTTGGPNLLSFVTGQGNPAGVRTAFIAPATNAGIAPAPVPSQGGSSVHHEAHPSSSSAPGQTTIQIKAAPPDQSTVLKSDPQSVINGNAAAAAAAVESHAWEPCKVCGDKASGRWCFIFSLSLSLLLDRDE